MKTLTMWNPNQTAINAKLLNEVAASQVDFWPKDRIRATWPEGYDTSKINRQTSDPEIILRSIFIC